MTQSVEIVPTAAHAARNRLSQLVEDGKLRTATVAERILSRVPDDTLVRAAGLSFEVPAAHVEMTALETTWSLHRNALDQLSSRVGIPTAYVQSLLDVEDPNGDDHWRRPLLESILDQHVKHASGRFLVRGVEGQARAILSDRYRRLDSRPLLTAFIAACDKIGAVPYEGVATDLSASVRAIVPRVYEPVDGEALVFGLEWGNSDFGLRAYSLSTFVLRLTCLNGMVGSNRLKQVHLGGRLPDHLEFSERTYQLDTRTMVSATKDVVTTSLGDAAIGDQLAAVRAAHSTEVDWSSAWRRVSRDLNKAEQKLVKDSFEGPDVINLPAGRTTWRLSNAVSWLANATEDPERKLDLQRLAGTVVAQAA